MIILDVFLICIRHLNYIFTKYDFSQLWVDPVLITKRIIHSQVGQQHLTVISSSSVLNKPPPEIEKSKTQLTRQTQKSPSKISTNKSPLL